MYGMNVMMNIEFVNEKELNKSPEPNGRISSFQTPTIINVLQDISAQASRMQNLQFDQPTTRDLVLAYSN